MNVARILVTFARILDEPHCIRMGKQHGSTSHFLLLRLAPPRWVESLLRLNTSEETCPARLRGDTAFANVAPLSRQIDDSCEHHPRIGNDVVNLKAATRASPRRARTRVRFCSGRCGGTRCVVLSYIARYAEHSRTCVGRTAAEASCCGGEAVRDWQRELLSAE